MRILHVSDFHFRRPWFTWLAVRAAEFDACCLTGDLIDLLPNARVGWRRQVRWVQDWLREFPGKLCVCSGNHDWWADEQAALAGQCGWLHAVQRPGIAVDGASECVNGYRFVCCQWGGMPAVDGSQPTVLLAHAPPLATSVAAGVDMEVGDADVADATRTLRRGSLVLSGHCHEPRLWYGRLGSAWCFNPGVDFRAAEPNHIVIDTEARQAVFHGWGRKLRPIQFG